MSDFRSPKEIMAYLLEKEDNKIISKSDKTIIGFVEDGKLYNFTRITEIAIFPLTAINVNNWSKYEPKQWYENIPEGGVLCWIRHVDAKNYGSFLARVTRYNPESTSLSELDSQGRLLVSYQVDRAIPLTREDIGQFLVNETKLWN